jgi:inorganic pyrophosphatase
MKPLIKRSLYSILDKGKGFDRRIFLLDDKQNKISLWNDIPIKFEGYESDTINTIIEIPRYTLGKLELRKDEPYHPIAHETRTNRYVKDKIELMYWTQFPLFNYGYVPQTWENSLLPNKEVLNILVT